MHDPFLLLNLPRGFDLDDCVLRGALIKASLDWHPDRFALASEQERQRAEAKMAELNEAYAQLRDPLQRAEILLSLAGFPLGEGSDHTSSPEFLMEMMEWKEKAAEHEKGDNPEQLHVFCQQLQQEIDQRVEKLRDGFRAWQKADYCPGTVAPLRALLTEAIYLQRTLDSLQEATQHHHD